MGLREKRNENARAIAEGRFISHVLSEEGKELNQDIDKKMTADGFRSGFWRDKTMTVTGSGNNLEYRHKKPMRFVDMSVRITKGGRQKKASHKIHNRIIYGRLNPIAHQLSYGFTDAVVADMLKLEGEL